MATISNIAQRILDENNYDTSDISLTNLEYLIDNAIDYVNLMANTTMADLDGSAESKSLTGTENEIIIVKFLSVLLLRAYIDRSPNVSLAGLSVATVLADPQYSLFKEAVDQGIQRLKAASPAFNVAEATS